MLTELHVKKTDAHQYLHYNSCHPGHCKQSILYGEALRIKCICSRSMDYDGRVRDLKGFLVSRGYKDNVVQNQIEKTTKVWREDLLHPWTI